MSGYKEGYVGPESERLLDVSTTPAMRRLALAYLRRTQGDWEELAKMLGLVTNP